MRVKQKRATLPSGDKAPTKMNQTLCWQCFTASTAAFTKQEHKQKKQAEKKKKNC